MARTLKDWEAEWKKVSAESRKLAKRANQRMVRLERYARERPEYAGALQFAYRKAQQYIRNTFGPSKSGKPGRYKEYISFYKPKGLSKAEQFKANVLIQRARIQEMEKFLESASSTLGRSRLQPNKLSLKDVMDKRTKAINDKLISEYGTEYEMSTNDLKRFFESKKQAKLQSLVTSDLMFIVASVIKKNKLKSNKRDFKKFLKEHIDLESESAKKAGLTAEDLKDQTVDGKKETFVDMLDRLDEFVRFTGDELLDDKVKEALKKGINVTNIFI